MTTLADQMRKLRGEAEPTPEEELEAQGEWETIVPYIRAAAVDGLSYVSIGVSGSTWASCDRLARLVRGIAAAEGFAAQVAAGGARIELRITW